MTRVALVTGAARGIGAATVRALAAEGWAVVATDRCADDPRLPYPMGTREELEALSGDLVVPVVADTTSEADLARAVAVAQERFGGLDAALAVAGVVAGGVPLWEQEAEQLQAVLDVDLGGVVALARVAIPVLLQRPAPRDGRFLAVSSAAATRGLPMLAAYCAAKAGVNGLVRGLAAELRGTGVTASCVSPGSTRTPVLEESARLYGLADAEHFARQQPLERLLEPEEVAAALVWLAGMQSSGVTGADVSVDGGLALCHPALSTQHAAPGVPTSSARGVLRRQEEGVKVVLDPRTRVRAGGRTLLTPTGRLLRLTDQGAAQLADPEPALARRLVEAGAAHPHPEPRPAVDVTVVVPVRDRVRELEVCLAALHSYDVLVVDDGSTEDVAAVCGRHGARHVRRANGGPAAARNTALPLLDKDFVAFLDSDCLPPRGWLEQLRGHFDDPSVVAVAPRVTGGPRSPLDLGPHSASVRPGTGVSYVPTAALLVRRSALLPFDEALRYGEDVDLVWRLIDAGGVVRYDPDVVVEHAEPIHLRDRLVRRYRYGTSAAPLSVRHPGKVTHLVLRPWPTAVVALALAHRPVLAAAVAAASTARLDRQVHDLPLSARCVADASAGTALGLGRTLQLAGPLAWWLATRDRRAALLLLAPIVRDWRENRPSEDLLDHTARTLLDQAAYGAGVFVGCVTHRTLSPLVGRNPGPRGRTLQR